MASVKRHINCPICKAQKFKVLKEYTGAHLVKCKNCKAVYSERIPSEKELSDHYAHYNRARSVSKLTLKKYEQLLKGFHQYRKTNKVLDVGCGSGFFLDVASQLNWDSFGTEYGEEAVSFCRAKGLAVFEGAIESLNLESDSFDIITSFEVIEHLSYPLTHFEALFRLLRPGGILYVTTPNFNAITRNILKEDWDIITYPEHLTYFTSSTLNKGLESVGFKRKKMIADGISIDRLRNSLNKRQIISENNAASSSQKNKIVLTNESIRQASENSTLFRFIRKTIDFGLNTTRKGEFLKGYYIKPNTLDC